MAGNLVYDYIHSDRVVIFSKITCPYCVKVKKIFCELQVKYISIELDHTRDKDVIMDVLERITDRTRTVPKVFINGVFEGGCSEIEALYRSGRLADLLGIDSGCGCCSSF